MSDIHKYTKLPEQMPVQIIHWFRQDLRLSDNPAFTEAVRLGSVIPIYIIDPADSPLGGASRWWQAQSLQALNYSLGDNLNVFRGSAKEILQQISTLTNIQTLTWTRRYDPSLIEKDRDLKTDLEASGLTVKSYGSNLLWEPWEVMKPDESAYRVFTAFYKKCLASPMPKFPIPEPINFDAVKLNLKGNEQVSLDLLMPVNWGLKKSPMWCPGENGAKEGLRKFLDDKLQDYKNNRDFPALEHTSMLSPHLHFGEISPRQIWYAAKAALVENAYDQGAEHFLKELVWREFSHHLLYHNPQLINQNLQSKFDAYPWSRDTTQFNAWTAGKTGIPIIDAGMRELWQTGYMHNRVRMITASFLTKNLGIDWRLGAEWFFDTLVDADLANNTVSWQWVAGCGADAAPFFRIFNPVTQSKKFDSNGDYIRRWIPELANLDNKWINSPWEAPANSLNDANIRLGETYPTPIVDLKQSRQFALEHFRALSITK